MMDLVITFPSIPRFLTTSGIRLGENNSMLCRQRAQDLRRQISFRLFRLGAEAPDVVSHMRSGEYNEKGRRLRTGVAKVHPGISRNENSCPCRSRSILSAEGGGYIA